MHILKRFLPWWYFMDHSVIFIFLLSFLAKGRSFRSSSPLPFLHLTLPLNILPGLGRILLSFSRQCSLSAIWAWFMLQFFSCAQRYTADRCSGQKILRALIFFMSKPLEPSVLLTSPREIKHCSFFYHSNYMNKGILKVLVILAHDNC